MPIEIKELVIRAVAHDEAAHVADDGRRTADDLDADALVEACVEQVLRILRRERER